MSDPRVQVDQARVALRRAIAGAMVRKEEAERAIERLRAALAAQSSDEALASSAEDRALARDVAEALEDLRSQVDVQQEALALAEADIETLKRELQGLDALEREAERLALVKDARAAAEPPATERATLDRARASIHALEAEARLNDELTSSSASLRRIEQATAEAAAKARLAELKAQHATRRASEPSAPATDDPDAVDALTPKRKRTL